MIKSWWADCPDETIKETAWERQMHMAGFEAYERSKVKANGASTTASDTSHGQAIIKTLIRPVIESIATVQDEVFNKHRLERSTKGTVMVVPAETLALMTIRTLIDACLMVEDVKRGSQLQSVCLRLSKSVETEMNFRNWIKESKEASKAYANAMGYKSIPKSYAEKLIEEQGASVRQIARWKNSFKELSEFTWIREERSFCGDVLITAAVTALPQDFEIVLIRHRNMTKKHVRLTEAGMKKFDDLDRRMAQTADIKRPMITRPKPWTRS